jgi:Putative zinc-finger
VERMTPPEEHNRYREQIGAFLLGVLDEGERTAMQTHLSSCPVCQAEVRALKPVVAALADAAPDRIDEDPLPPEDLEESTLAPILGEIHRARRRRRRLGWSALAAAAICVVVIGLAGFTWLLEPAVSLEPRSFSGVAPSVEVEGHLIAHTWGTEIRLVVSGLRDGQTYRVTLVSEDGERVNSGTFIGIGDKPLRCTLNAAMLPKDAAKLEVRTSSGELVFFAELPENSEGADPESAKGPSTEDTAPRDKQEKPEAPGSGGGTPPKKSAPESGNKGSSPGREKPGAASPAAASPRAAPEESEPGRSLYEGPPADDQYQPQL